MASRPSRPSARPPAGPPAPKPNPVPIVVSIILIPTDDGNLQIAAIQGVDPLTLPIMARILGEAQQQVIAQFISGNGGGDN